MDCVKTYFEYLFTFFLTFPIASNPKWKFTSSLCLPLVHANALKGEQTWTLIDTPPGNLEITVTWQQEGHRVSLKPFQHLCLGLCRQLACPEQEPCIAASPYITVISTWVLWSRCSYFICGIWVNVPRLLGFSFFVCLLEVKTKLQLLTSWQLKPQR